MCYSVYCAGMLLQDTRPCIRPCMNMPMFQRAPSKMSHSLGSLQSLEERTWHTVFDEAEHSAFTPAIHVPVASQAVHGLLPDNDQVEPVLHGISHTVSAVVVHVVLTPAAEHVVHALHGALPDDENEVPVSHATWHTVSVEAVQVVLTPVGHVEAAAHGAQEGLA